jgi:hypothetical protein
MPTSFSPACGGHRRPPIVARCAKLGDVVAIGLIDLSPLGPQPERDLAGLETAYLGNIRLGVRQVTHRYGAIVK